METFGVTTGDTELLNVKVKSELQMPLCLPPTLKRRISLSDIIAATIGEEARTCDLNYEHNVSNNTSITEPHFLDDSSNSQHDFQPSLYTENSNNACDFLSFRQKNEKTYNLTSNSEQQQDLKTSFGTEPMINLGFDTNFDFLSDIIQADIKVNSADATTSSMEAKNQKTKPDETQEASYDSDLEDSMHFIDPDDKSFHTAEQTTKSCESVLEIFKNAHETVLEPVCKRSRLSIHDTSSCPLPGDDNNFSDCSPEFMAIFDLDIQPPTENTSGSKIRHPSYGRNRSFSGHTKPKLSRQHGKNNLLSKHHISSIGRHRSFSEACNRDNSNSSGDGQFSSLLSSPEFDQISDKPFYSDLKSLLLSDCQTIDCPRTLFETLSNTPKQDVYARERNLQAKFSTLQSRYPDEVRDLSGFFRQQSAEIETERLKKIHDDNVPTSYRKHLNRFYDDQLHRIMERVEKSLSLLSTVKREFVSINRHFKSRPLLSKKAVAMMEEWYSRNYEHPYPSPTAVEALAGAGDITPEQVKKWFANKRNRCKNTKPVPEIANLKRKRQYSARW